MVEMAHIQEDVTSSSGCSTVPDYHCMKAIWGCYHLQLCLSGGTTWKTLIKPVAFTQNSGQTGPSSSVCVKGAFIYIDMCHLWIGTTTVASWSTSSPTTLTHVTHATRSIR